VTYHANLRPTDSLKRLLTGPAARQVADTPHAMPTLAPPAVRGAAPACGAANAGADGGAAADSSAGADGAASAAPSLNPAKKISPVASLESLLGRKAISRSSSLDGKSEEATSSTAGSPERSPLASRRPSIRRSSSKASLDSFHRAILREGSNKDLANMVQTIPPSPSWDMELPMLPPLMNAPSG
jgi:hypothetical protein